MSIRISQILIKKLIGQSGMVNSLKITIILLLQTYPGAHPLRKYIIIYSIHFRSFIMLTQAKRK